MKSCLNLSVSFLIVAALIAVPFAAAQDQPIDSAQAAMMEKYRKLAEPNEAHKRLETLAGTWHQEIKLWLSPGAEPMTVDGTCTNEMILGGRFLVTSSQSGFGASTTESKTIIGFDNRFEHYTIVGMDTWGTYYITAAGKWDDSTRTITMYGEDEDPIMGFTQQYDMVFYLIDDNTYKQEIIFKDEVNTQGQGDFKMVEITFSRAE